jgi:hypothetical protein
MNIQDLAEYVEQDVEDSFSTEDIARWFNKGIAQYNLLPPLTRYPYITIGVTATPGSNILDETTPYPLSDTFMLGVMLPFLAGSIRGSESAIQERQLHLSDFVVNATTFKRSIDVPFEFMLNNKNTDLSNFELGEGVFLGDFTRSPFSGEWQRPSLFSEIVAEEEE